MIRPADPHSTDLSRRTALLWRSGCAVALLAVAGCTSTGSDDGAGTTLKNILLYGGTTVPPIAEKPPVEAADCPAVTVREGGAAMRIGGTGEGEAARAQISIANVARECTERPDGAIVVKVGVEGRVLLGPGGSGNRFDAPVTIALKRNDQVLASKTQRASVTLPAGRFEQNFVVIQGDLVVPPGTPDYDIEVGLGSGGSAEKPARTRKRAR